MVDPNHWTVLFKYPILSFFVLLILSYFIYRAFFLRTLPAMSSGYIVMAISLFALSVLPALHINALIYMWIALLILIIWLYIMVGYLQGYLQGAYQCNKIEQQMNIGTWIAGSAFAAILLKQAVPIWYGSLLLLTIVTFSLAFIYVLILARWFYVIAKSRSRFPDRGTALLISVSLLSMILLMNELFHRHIRLDIYATSIWVAAGFYLLAVLVLLKHWLFAHRSHFIAVFPDTGSLLYGALSLIGLTILNTEAYPPESVTQIWFFALGLLLLVESVTLKRIFIGWQRRGFKGISYATTQWARLFSLTAFYAFTSVYWQIVPNNWAGWIAEFGQYAVLLLFMFEVVNMTQSQLAKRTI